MKQIFILFLSAFMGIASLNAQTATLVKNFGSGNFITGLAVNSNGDIYVAFEGISTVYKVSSSGSILNTFSIPSPEQMCIDASNNVYVASYGSLKIAKILANGTLQSSFTSSVSYNVASVAVNNANGEVYMGGRLGSISKVTSNGGTPTAVVPSTTGSSVNYLGMDFDNSGNLYVVDRNGNNAYKLLSGATTPSSFAIITNGVNIVFDGNSQLYATERSGSAIKKISMTGSVSNFYTVSSGAYALAMDKTNKILYYSSGDKVYKVSTTCTPTTGTFTVSACDSYTWAAKGNKVYTANNNTDTIHLTNAGGCDSLVTLNLTITTGTFTSTAQASCNSYTWAANGQTYTTSGTYVRNYNNANGCASADTLKLTIKSTKSTNNLSICPSALPYTWNGLTFNTAGSQTATLTNAAGCDSAATLNLTLRSCETGALNFDGVNDYVSVPYNVALNPTQFTVQCWVKTSNSNSFASILSSRDGSNANNTRGYTFYKTDQNKWAFWTGKGNTGNSWNFATSTANINPGVWTHLTGTYSNNIMSLYVNGVLVASTTCQFSPNTVYPLLIGTGANEFGVGNYVFYAPMTVDDVRIWNRALTQSEILNNMNCEIAGPVTNLVANYQFNQGSFNASNSGVTTLLDVSGNNYNGTLNNFSLNGLSSNWVPHNITSVNACSSYTWNGTTYTSSTTVAKMLTSSSGCDSVAAIILTINQPSAPTFTSLSACNSYTWNGTTYTTSGSYTKNFINAAGCDSTVTLNLTVKATSTSTTNLSICPSALPYTWNGLTFNTAGSQTATLTNAAGCDSAATLNLSVKQVYTISASAGSNGSISNAGISSVCQGNNSSLYTITANSGYIISDVLIDGVSSGAITSYTFTNVTANHTIVANFVLPCSPSNSSNFISICSSELPYSWNGLIFNSAGTQTAHLTNTAGCDSIASLTLSLKSAPSIGVSTGGNICGIGGTLSVYNTNTLNGGVWSSSNNNIATVSTAGNGAGGLATGVSKGTVVLTYTKTSAENGCTVSASCVVNVIAPTISGPATICKGNTAQLSVNETGGYWVSNNNKAAITTTGLLTATNAGNASISYVLGGCTNVNTYTPTVVAAPAAPVIGYAPGSTNPQLGAGSAYCNNRTFTLVGSPAGGVWSSTNTNVVTVTSGGVATTVGLGNGSVVYTYTNTAGCSSSRSIVGNVVACAARGINNEQLAMSNDFTIFPNPAKSVVSVQVDKLIGNGKLFIIDYLGKVVKEQPLSMGTNTIDIANLSKGLYFVSTITSEGKTTKKLVVE